MKNQLSKREYKYRCKIIAENHLKKECQIYLGNYMVTEGFTYKEIYFDEALLNRMLTSYSFWRVGEAIIKTGVAMKQAPAAFNNFACVVNAVSQAVDVDGIVSNIKRTYGLSDKQADELLRLAEDYAVRHVITCGDVLYEVGRKIREDGYTMRSRYETEGEMKNGRY